MQTSHPSENQAPSPGATRSSTSDTVQAIHDALHSRWAIAGKPEGATKRWLVDIQDVIGGQPGHLPIEDALRESAELLEAWISGGAAATPHELALVIAAKSGKPKTRVMMVSEGVPAYQNDFLDQNEAITVAARLAAGCKTAQKMSMHGDLIRYDVQGGFIRAFALSA